MNYLKNHQPSYSDSYLMSMTKKQLIEHIRILEHNIDVVEEQSKNQYRLLSKVSDEEIKRVIKWVFLNKEDAEKVLKGE